MIGIVTSLPCQVRSSRLPLTCSRPAFSTLSAAAGFAVRRQRVASTDGRAGLEVRQHEAAGVRRDRLEAGLALLLIAVRSIARLIALRTASWFVGQV